MMKFSVAVGLMLTMCSALGAQGKMVASENDVVSVGHVVDQVAVESRMLFSQVQDKLVIVQCDDSVGTGFVCEMDGRRYFVTNKHVVQGQDRIVAVFGNGTKLKFGKLEIAQGVDLVRFAVATNQPALKLCDAEPEMNQAIFVFGNSDGGGVFTDLPGRILGVGPDQVEISSEIVHGNSGSAVLDEKGRVVGVATSATRVNNPADWVKKDTRFKEVRRYALRLKNINWKQISLKKFYKKYREAEEKRQREIGIYPQVRASFKTPSMHVNKYQTYGDPRFWINGNIVLGLSNIKNVKNPVVRAAFLVNCGTRRIIMDAVTFEPGGNYRYTGVPIFSYSMRNDSWTFDVGNGVHVYYLEGMSYYQPPFAGTRAKDIDYVDRSNFLRGGFEIPSDKLTPGVVPKIVAFRLECWQNGSLACAYNSLRPDTLNSKMIPVDWFVIGRYPRLFDYVRAWCSSF